MTFFHIGSGAGEAGHGCGMRQGKAKDLRRTVSYPATSNDPVRHMQQVNNSLPPALLRKSSDDTRAQQPQGGKSRNPECPVDYARIAWCASTPIPLNTGMPFCPALSRSLPSQPSSLGLSNSKCQTAGALMLHEQIRPVLCLHTGIVSVRTVGAILHSPAGPSRHHI